MTDMPLTVMDIATPFAGVRTGLNKVFIVSLEDAGTFETGILRKVVRDRGGDRYGKAVLTNYIVWPYDKNGGLLSEETLSRNYPKTYQYLSKHKSSLLSRATNKKWYALLRPSDQRLMICPKLFCPWARDKSRVGVDLSGNMMFLGSGRSCGIALTNSDVSPYTLLGILNSKIIRKYICHISPHFGETLFIYSVSIVKKLPVPSINKLRGVIGQKIEKLVKQILDNKDQGNDTAALEHKVDDLVRELYGIPVENAEPQNHKKTEDSQPLSIINNGNLSCLSSLMVS